MRAGARDLLAPDAPEAEMHEVFTRALDSSRRMRENLVGSIETGTPTGRVITVSAPKGGSGKTAVSSNLAVTLARHAPGQVVLVDLDLQFGDQAHALLLSPEHTMSDVVRWDRLDIITLKAFLTPRHDDLYVLAAPETPAAGELIDPDRVAHVLDLLAHEFPFVVIDTPAGLTEHTLTAIEHATDLVLICDMDVASVRGLRKLREALDQLGMSQQQRHYLLNRSDSRVGIDIDDAAATIGSHFDIKMPSARTVPMSMNQGTPFVESAPRSGVARAIDDLAGRFLDRPDERSGGFLRRKAHT
jgi:pilus assembly protein CpaE